MQVLYRVFAGGDPNRLGGNGVVKEIFIQILFGNNKYSIIILVKQFPENQYLILST
jgi:hypothetical protein